MKKLLIIMAALLFVAPVAMSQDKELWGFHFAVTDPGDTALEEMPPWFQHHNAGDPVVFPPVPPYASIYLGIHNESQLVNLKTLVLTLTGFGVDGFDVDWVKGWITGGQATGVSEFVVDNTTPDVLVVVVEFFPQPEWEVLKLTNNSETGIVIEAVVCDSECVFIPTMTYYGIGILALLLIGSTVWILRRKRVGSVA